MILDADDLLTVADWSIASLLPALDRDGSVPAGELAWTCRRTLDHLPDALLFHGAQLARRADEFRPAGRADAEGYLGLACDEILVHTHDIAAGLGVPLDPPVDIATRVLRRIFPWAPGAGVSKVEGADP